MELLAKKTSLAGAEKKLAGIEERIEVARAKLREAGRDVREPLGGEGARKAATERQREAEQELSLLRMRAGEWQKLVNALRAQEAIAARAKELGSPLGEDLGGLRSESAAAAAQVEHEKRLTELAERRLRHAEAEQRNQIGDAQEVELKAERVVRRRLVHGSRLAEWRAAWSRSEQLCELILLHDEAAEAAAQVERAQKIIEGGK